MNFFKCCFTQYLLIIHLFIIISYQSFSLIGSFKIAYSTPPKYKECLFVFIIVHNAETKDILALII